MKRSSSVSTRKHRSIHAASKSCSVLFPVDLHSNEILDNRFECDGTVGVFADDIDESAGVRS